MIKHYVKDIQLIYVNRFNTEDKIHWDLWRKYKPNIIGWNDNGVVIYYYSTKSLSKESLKECYPYAFLANEGKFDKNNGFKSQGRLHIEEVHYPLNMYLCTYPSEVDTLVATGEMLGIQYTKGFVQVLGKDVFIDSSSDILKREMTKNEVINYLDYDKEYIQL